MDLTITSILVICFIFLMTCFGSAIIFLFKKNINPKYSVYFNTFAGGIMLASSFFSLLFPAVASSESYGSFDFVPVCIGVLFGCLFMFSLDFFLNKTKQGVENKRNRLTKNQKIFIAISLHNIPEGLSVGVALGSAFIAGSSVSVITAVSLAVGIAIQNVPEGLAVSLPMYEQNGKKVKAFFYGVFSAILEPISAVIGIFLSSIFSFLLPWFLAFAGGTMIFTVVNEVLSENRDENLKSKNSWIFIAGFILMMLLDVAFA